MDRPGRLRAGGIHPDQHAFAFLPGSPGTIFSGNDGGIWKSTSRGASWTNLNSGLALTRFYSIAGSPSSFLIGGVQDNGCVKYTGSSSWTIVQGGDGGWTGVESSNPNIVYCDCVNLNFQKSSDGGNTWASATTGINLNDKSEFIAPVGQDPNTPGTLYIGGTHVYKTTDFASTWTDVSGVVTSSLISEIVVAPSSSSTVYLGDESGSVKVSTNGGATWQTLGTIPGYKISGLAVDQTNPNLIYVAAADSNTLYKFVLQSGAWQETRLGTAPDVIDVVRVNTAGTLFIGTDHGVYYSTDSGATWASPGTGLPNLVVYDLEVTSSNQLIAATHGRGAWIVTPTAVKQTVLTIGYSVSGGGSGYLTPVLTYVSNGVQQTASLGSALKAYTVDSGSTWSVTNPLTGSSSTERWQTNQATSGTIASPLNVSLVFYHQYLVSVSYAVSGHGTPQAPTFSYDSFGTSSSLTLGATAQSVWADSGAYSATNPLGGSTANERWFAISSSGTIQSPGTLTLAYAHQYLLTSIIVSTSSQWYDEGSTASFSTPGVFGRSSGVGSRIVSYTLDGGSANMVTPTAGTVAVSVLMNAPHVLAFATVTQYQVSLDTGAASALSSITSPTILGDDYWYDSGTAVNCTLNGVYGRSGGTGTKLTGYEVNGGSATTISTIGTVDVLNVIAISSAQSITVTSVTQYQVSLDAGATQALNSITAPTVKGDGHWYDAGTSVAVALNGVFGRSSGAGNRLASYSVNGTAPTSADTTASVSVLSVDSISSPESITTRVVAQYQLSTPTGSVASTTSPTVSGDMGWYDAGTTVSVGYNDVWNTVSQASRLIAASYAVDGGQATPVPEVGSGTFSVNVTMNSAHTVDVKFVMQYFVAFQFTNASGSEPITPTVLQIAVAGQTREIPGFTTWLDSGAAFTVSQVS